MEWYYIYPLLILAGIACGFINILAGCGGAISLSVLNFFVPLNIANGTFRIPILLQNISGVHEFKKHNAYTKKTSIPILIPIILGGICGTLSAVYIPHSGFKFFVGVMMLVLFVIQLVKIFHKNKKQPIEYSDNPKKYNPILVNISYFVVGMYGGFIQVGVGIFLLLTIEYFSKTNLFRANAIKILAILCYTIPAALIFMFNGLIDWKLGIIMAIGNIIGAKIAVKSSAKINTSYIRVFVIIILLIAGLFYTGIFTSVSHVLD
ncbi:MAG TPA: sulfite exporter TauE/SafE family protein [Victivallales bacterium]|nr:sulfite exporter TauE/SafE family protein [Victivallales bacterium]